MKALVRNYLSPEICKIEREITLVAVPVSILVMAVYLLECYYIKDILIALAESTIGVSVVCLVDREIIFHIRKKYPHFSTGRRITFQVILTFLHSFALVTVMYFAHMFWVQNNFAHDEKLFFLKGLGTTLLLFTFIINGNYEVLFLFEKLHQERIEKEKFKESVIEARLENLRSQINPHFLFNTFNALSELIDENPKQASEVLMDISDLYRYVLQVRDKNWETMENEFRIAHSFIAIVKSRYENNVHIHFNIDKPYLNWYLPPLSLQMLIENAIKHNQISTEKNLSIKISTRNGFLEVSNNYQPRINYDVSNGVGLKNIENRYAFLLNKHIEIIQDENQFLVRLPLIQKVEEV